MLFATNEDALYRIAGLFLIVLGPPMARLYTEILIVVFRINETLTEILNELKNRP